MTRKPDKGKGAPAGAFAEKFYADMAASRESLERRLHDLLDGMQAGDPSSREALEKRLSAYFERGEAPGFSVDDARAAWRAVATDLVVGREPLRYTRIAAGMIMAAALDDPQGLGKALNPRGRGRPAGSRTRQQLRAKEAVAIGVASGWLADERWLVAVRGESARERAASEAGMSTRKLERILAKRREK